LIWKIREEMHLDLEKKFTPYFYKSTD
jgi:hypothetical protein